jgi:hypothetical protein
VRRYVQSRFKREAVSEEETAAGVHAEDRLQDSREPEESKRIPKVEHCSQSILLALLLLGGGYQTLSLGQGGGSTCMLGEGGNQQQVLC